MGKKSPPPKPPDLKPITDAQLQIAKETNELAREQLGLSKEQFAWFQENAKEELALAREQADRLFEFQNKAFESDQDMKEWSKQIGEKQMEGMNLQMEYARKDRERYESVFLPMQDQYIDEANNYDTPDRREAEASRAMVDIQRQAEAARTNSDQRLRSMGIDPSQMRSATLLDTQNVAMAANQALAGNAARQGVEDRGRAMRADALNVGAGLPAQALAGYAGAGAAGQGALSAGQAGQAATLGAIQGGAGVAGTAMGFRSNALNNVAALTGSPMQWASMGSGNMGQASNAYGNAANTMSQGFNNQMASWQAGQQQAQQQFNNVMSVASLAGGMMMAEGGAVGAISREKFPISKAVIEGDFKRVDGLDVKGKKPAISFASRLDNGMQAASDYAASAGSSEQAPIRSEMVVHQTQLTGDGQQYAAEGGRMRARGALPVKQARDNIPAYLTEGEYVVPADVVRAVGLEKLDKMVAKYHRANA